MSGRDDLVSTLDRAGVLVGIRWAYLSAAGRVLEDYSEAAGHDATWVGVTRFTLFRDRLDRVFSCRRYAAAEVLVGRTREVVGSSPRLRSASSMRCRGRKRAPRSSVSESAVRRFHPRLESPAQVPARHGGDEWLE